MPRKTKQLAVRDEFLILTNGKRTEKNYFEAVRSNYKSIFKISVKFMNDDPVALVDHAIGMKNARNRVWCVFDKDEFPTDSVEPAIKTAKENGIGIAFSNIAFEVWLIDHFEKCHTEKTAEKLIADFDRILRAKGYTKGYAKEDKQMSNYYYNNHANSIMETYLRQVYDGSDREDLLKSSNNELILSEQAIKDFEAFLNHNIPLFDREMYESISVHADEQGHISIFLNEKTGEQINLNETSAGRRWYFTYYFMKNILSEGDIFIIDEPAAMLHPSAQREVLRELIELTKRGIKVVYSTHSPYLIPDERRCVHFVMMTEDGTKVNGVSSNQELINQMADIIGEDIFDIQTVFDMYAQGDTTEIGRKCYNAIKRQGEKLEDAASKLFVSVETIKSWNRNGNHFRCPKLENIIAVSKYTNIKIQDLLN